MHIGASEPVTFMACVRQPAEPVGFVRELSEESHSFVLDIAGVDMHLGVWWLDVARRGAVKQLPVVNQHPQFEGETPHGPKAITEDKRVWWEKGDTVVDPEK